MQEMLMDKMVQMAVVNWAAEQSCKLDFKKILIAEEAVMDIMAALDKLGQTDYSLIRAEVLITAATVTLTKLLS